MRHAFRIAPGAAAQIREAAGWWLENRPKAPTALVDDLEQAFDLIAELPGSGELVSHAHVTGIRRLLLGCVRYYLYHRKAEEPATIEVLAFWHASRGSAPEL